MKIKKLFYVLFALVVFLAQSGFDTNSKALVLRADCLSAMGYRFEFGNPNSYPVDLWYTEGGNPNFTTVSLPEFSSTEYVYSDADTLKVHYGLQDGQHTKTVKKPAGEGWGVCRDEYIPVDDTEKPNRNRGEYTPPPDVFSPAIRETMGDYHYMAIYYGNSRTDLRTLYISSIMPIQTACNASNTVHENAFGKFWIVDVPRSCEWQSIPEAHIDYTSGSVWPDNWIFDGTVLTYHPAVVRWDVAKRLSEDFGYSWSDAWAVAQEWRTTRGYDIGKN